MDDNEAEVDLAVNASLLKKTSTTSPADVVMTSQCMLRHQQRKTGQAMRQARMIMLWWWMRVVVRLLLAVIVPSAHKEYPHHQSSWLAIIKLQLAEVKRALL